MKDFKHQFFDQIFYHDRLDSTYNRAETMIKLREARGNFLIMANEQTNGRGRRDNFWLSPPGGIWMTAGLYGLPLENGLTIFTGMILNRVVGHLFPQLIPDLKLKWPNDLLIKNRKLAGILTGYFSPEKYHLLGIGINSNLEIIPEQIASIATSLKLETGLAIDDNIILKLFWDNFSADLPHFLEQGLSPEEFRSNSYLINREIILQTQYDSFRGIARGITKTGALLLELKKGMIQPFFSGQITLADNSGEQD
ncbi:MAG: biotin--[acetyl-CoA-carboxylase] ligase [Candidatus Cloacimonetes bacterium]|nr:biotin--[acetyl-CoA-carboxylase] ligase [Candidatus Cloacimonadota bacterium]